MKKQDKQQSLDKEQLEAVTGGMNSNLVHSREYYTELQHRYSTFPDVVKPIVLEQIIQTVPLKIREPLHAIPEEPKLEQAHQIGWISENLNKRRRLDLG